jgi:hypothetical protein
VGPRAVLDAVVKTGDKAAGREADNSPPSSAEVKNAWSYTSIRLHGVVFA